MKSFRNGNIEAARHLESVLLPMTKTIMKHGPGGIKAAMDSLGFFGGDPQSPLKRPSPQGLEDIQKALAAVKEAV